MDNQLKEILSYLSSSELSKNTIVVLVSSHGEAFGEHGRFSHEQIPYNELLHTPLIIKIPGYGSSRVIDVTENIDIFPTLTDAVGVPTPPTLEGRSLLPFFTGSSWDAGYAFSQIREMQAIQDKDWKLISHPETGQKELYHLSSDPGEEHNVSEENPSIVSELSGRIKYILDRSDTVRRLVVPIDLPGQKRNQLIQEGYF